MGAKGEALLDFGAHPGSMDASLDVATAGVIATSAIEAWLLPRTTVDHSVDEQRLEELSISAVYKVDGTLTILGHSKAEGNRSKNGHNLYGKFNVGWVWE